MVLMCNIKKENKTIHVSKDLWLVLNQIKLDKDLGTMNDVIDDLVTRIKFLDDCGDYVDHLNCHNKAIDYMDEVFKISAAKVEQDYKGV